DGEHPDMPGCQKKNLSLNAKKTKVLVMDFMRRDRAHTPIIINGTPVESFRHFRNLRVHITKDLT
ncbi:hypothetical protein M9458_008483, partial [Cirrhinus mrigala]